MSPGPPAEEAGSLVASEAPGMPTTPGTGSSRKTGRPRPLSGRALGNPEEEPSVQAQSETAPSPPARTERRGSSLLLSLCLLRTRVFNE